MSTTLPLLLILALLCRALFGAPRALGAEEPVEIDDDELVRLAKNGDRQAFNRLVGRYQRLMYNIAYRVLGDSDRAADATQDAFVTAYRRLELYRPGNFRGWLARIVKNQCYDLLRYEKRRPAASLDALLLTPGDPPPALERQSPRRPDDQAIEAEMADWLQQVILMLPHDQRMTLVMADVHGFSYEEIATATEVELGTVKSRLSRARRKVRTLLQQHAEHLPEQYRL